MAYVKKSIKKVKGSPGAPAAKNPNVVFLPADDIASFPARSGVRALAALALKNGEKAFSVYMTPSTISRAGASDGDPDKVGHTDTVTGFIPGITEAIDEFMQESMGEDYIVLTSECDSSNKRMLHGTPCNPMKVKFERQDDNSGKGYNVTIAQDQPDKYLPMHYPFDLPELADPATDQDGSGSAGDGLG